MTTPFLQFYREIPLTKGQITAVDDEDFNPFSLFKWQAHWNPLTQSFYAVRTHWIKLEKGRLQRTIQMHRAILNLKHGDKLTVDHINHDTLDNRRANLRIATQAEQTQNRRRAAGASGFIGVTMRPSGLYKAVIRADGVYTYLGNYKTGEEAHQAYCVAAKKLHGNFSRV